ncbi:MAG: Phosphoribosylamine-glycine ligase [Candidatus Kaiserbacteria bacterium GW2011_GWA2_49_19]|uniref:Phosphoribosylamine--glycine ligase n=2 Tax=Candidatus Kaiseribacteriota TaxID=1752734 RepID=A0A0G1VQB9_9BACT|nr:MAG: Phosphoribosylamine-glycine ligase [Candidatus Kaiserbacteria bacterium GW2011_GWA2_49_19]OGG60943.1 MAG: phosphoribosylamine--glycine ligase [Candidatus Kaiserbacteria bacterium RIFCSPHIGHO2_02_FULL_49_16]
MATDVLIVGGGGREHALAWKLKQSPSIGKLYIAPGNGGTRLVGENVPIEAIDFENLANFAEEKKISLTVIGPDNPLAEGIVDLFRLRGLRVWGPTKAAAHIEGSKAFAKNLMREAGVPTAEFEIFSNHDDALAYVRELGAPIVIKASGLSLGKGVYVCMTLAEAESALEEIMVQHVFKKSGDEVVIEEYLDGQEISIHALADGKDFVLFPPSQDHKQVGENDTGKNTGGMGAIAPVPWVGAEALKDIETRVVRPTLGALAEHGAPFSGILYPGLKMSSQGPKVLEFNARFGDPECQVYMRLLKTDLLDILEASADGKLAGTKIEWNTGFAVNIVLASGGYPDAYKKGFPVTGIEGADKVPGVVIFHAGIAIQGGNLVTSGGRVLGVSAVGDTLKIALDRAYEAVELINFEGKYFRRDIGAKALAQ